MDKLMNASEKAGSKPTWIPPAAYLQSHPATLQTALDGFIVTLSPGATAAQAWDLIKAQKDMSGFGGDYSAVYAAVVDQIQSLADTTGKGADAPLTRADMDALRQEQVDTRAVLVDTKAVLARLPEIANGNSDTEITTIRTEFRSLGDRLVGATTNAAIVGIRQ